MKKLLSQILVACLCSLGNNICGSY